MVQETFNALFLLALIAPPLVVVASALLLVVNPRRYARVAPAVNTAHA